jgi:hypothetical protein
MPSDTVRMEPVGMWKLARDLKPGDRLRSAFDVPAPQTVTTGMSGVTVVSVLLEDGGARVYSLEVDGL